MFQHIVLTVPFTEYRFSKRYSELACESIIVSGVLDKPGS